MKKLLLFLVLALLPTLNIEASRYNNFLGYGVDRVGSWGGGWQEQNNNGWSFNGESFNEYVDNDGLLNDYGV